MQYLVSAEEMRKADNHTIEKIGIPAAVLMERAALAALDCVERHCLVDKDSVGGAAAMVAVEKSAGCGKTALILTGIGNNGGDGLALARLLSERGFSVEVWCVCDEKKASLQWQQEMRILQHYSVDFSLQPQKDAYTVLVDALFGVGLSREVAGGYAEAIAIFNELQGWKLALDVPSGIDADTGKVWGCCVQADVTVTFGFCKRGLVLYPGREYAGVVEVADIGISEKGFMGEYPKMFTLNGPVKNLLPERRGDGNKGSFGKVLLVAGSVNMAGAAVLAARAAYRTGAGMVKVISPEENRCVIQTAIPEALFGTESQIESSVVWADVIAIGPGLGTDERASDLLKCVLKNSNKPLVVDADAINLIAADVELCRELCRQGSEGRVIILTPHVGELARLAGKTIAECVGDGHYRVGEIAADVATELRSIVVAKDAGTFVCKTGKPVYLNSNGNCGMATAGSGDVLTGIVAALLAQGMEAFDAAAAAVYLHGAAGDEATRRKGAHACMAGDIAESISAVCS